MCSVKSYDSIDFFEKKLVVSIPFERWKLRQKRKESVIRVLSNYTKKMRKREIYMCGIYFMYIELQIWK